MPPNPTQNRTSNQMPKGFGGEPRNTRVCEPCWRWRRACDSQYPCSRCVEACTECTLSSGSACETCRRRKTKCDGGNPCAYCANTGTECINNSERRKRSMGVPASVATPDAVAMDRIEDRLRRIEELITVFTPASVPAPVPAATHALTSGLTTQGDVHHGQEQGAFHKLSHPARQCRHSVLGVSVAMEQAELRKAYSNHKHNVCNENATALGQHSDKGCHVGTMSTPLSPLHGPRYSTPPISSKGHHASSSPPASQRSPAHFVQQSVTQPLTASMLNLTLSPSSSTSSSASSTLPQSAILISSGKSPDWAASMPSLMDQLSQRTFATSSFGHATEYPPYPLGSSPGRHHQGRE